MSINDHQLDLTAHEFLLTQVVVSLHHIDQAPDENGEKRTSVLDTHDPASCFAFCKCCTAVLTLFPAFSDLQK